jgi:hypothetical protein
MRWVLFFAKKKKFKKSCFSLASVLLLGGGNNHDGNPLPRTTTRAFNSPRARLRSRVLHYSRLHPLDGRRDEIDRMPPKKRMRAEQASGGQQESAGAEDEVLLAVNAGVEAAPGATRSPKMPPKKRTRAEHASGGQQSEGAEDETLRGNLDSLMQEAVTARVEAARRRDEDERARLLAEATEAAAKVTEEADATKAEAEKQRREVEESRVALEEEKAAMEKAHTFQKSKIQLDIGGHTFTTLRQTLTSVPDTYFASLFSGRFELTPDDDGAYFLDRDGGQFHHILSFLRDPQSFKLNADLTEGQRGEPEVEARFYGLLDRVMPYCAQERIGRSLVRRCYAGKKRDIQTAMAQARVFVFDIGGTTCGDSSESSSSGDSDGNDSDDSDDNSSDSSSSDVPPRVKKDATPFLNEKYQDLRFVITDRVVNGSPVWAAVGFERFMYCAMSGRMTISDESTCAEGRAAGFIYNRKQSSVVVAPTELPSDKWVRFRNAATLEAQFASALEACAFMSPACASPQCMGWTTTTRRWRRRSGSSPRSPKNFHAISFFHWFDFSHLSPTMEAYATLHFLSFPFPFTSTKTTLAKKRTH